MNLCRTVFMRLGYPICYIGMGSEVLFQGSGLHKCIELAWWCPSTEIVLSVINTKSPQVFIVRCVFATFSGLYLKDV